MDDMETGSMSGDSAPEDQGLEVPAAPAHQQGSAMDQNEGGEEAMAMSPPPAPAPILTASLGKAAAARAILATGSSGDQPVGGMDPAASITATSYQPSEAYLKEKRECLSCFNAWNEQDQIAFVEELLSSMCHYQHGSVNAFLKPMLQRDFVSLLPKRGLDHVAENVLSYLDAKSLCSAELVCRSWLAVISEGMLWKKLIEHKVVTDSLWQGLAERKGWVAYLFKPRPGQVHPNHSFYRWLYPVIIKDIEAIENNWRCGRHNLQRINCQSENSKVRLNAGYSDSDAFLD